MKTEELAKIDKVEITALSKEVVSFEKKVTDNVAKMSGKLPKNLSELEVTKGDSIEKQVMAVYSKIDGKAADLKEKRLEFTRVFDKFKKGFTESEKNVKTESDKLKGFAIAWNSEKNRRVKAEQEKLRKDQERKQKKNEVYGKMLKHYLGWSYAAYSDLKQRTENKYYSITDMEKLKEFVVRMKDNFSDDLLKKGFNKLRTENPFDLGDMSNLLSIKDVMPELIKKENEYTEEYKSFVKYLIDFYPSRVEQLKEMKEDEAKRKEEAEKLKAQQEKERKEQEEALAREVEDKEREKNIEALSESLEAEPSTEMSKGANVKLKYYPKDKAQLLKIINWYLTEEYSEMDFETLNKRLSFMRTAADRALNNDGLEIEGVEYKEDVRVRKSRS